MKNYYFTCKKECNNLCCPTPSVVDFEFLKKHYKDVPYLLKITAVHENFVKQYKDITFQNLLKSSLIIANAGNFDIYIQAEITAGFPNNQCIFLKDGLCGIYNDKPIKCSMFPFQPFIPLNQQAKLLETIKSQCRGINSTGDGEFLINYSGTKINTKYFNDYITFWNKSREINNSITILKNVETILAAQGENIVERIQKQQATEFVTVFKTYPDFYEKLKVKEKRYKIAQEEVLKAYEKRYHVPAELKLLFLQNLK